MSKEEKLIVLATLEAYRLQTEQKTPCAADEIRAIRVCQSIVEAGFGYRHRDEWMDEIVRNGYVSYKIPIDKWDGYEMLEEILGFLQNALETERQGETDEKIREGMLKAWLTDTDVSLDEMYLNACQNGYTNCIVEPRGTLEEFVVKNIKNGFRVAPLLASMENCEADYFVFDVTGFSSTPAKPIYTKRELAEALGVTA